MIICFRGKYAFLSNYYDYCPVTFDGLTYRNSEAAYQAAKMEDSEQRQKFMGLSPDEAKHLGKHLPIRPDWDDIRESVMREVIRAKFTQHKELALELVRTGDEELVEGNWWHDNYFGNCLCTMCYETIPGQNVLGKILMEEREYQKKLMEGN